jgi:tetratricopeptide (TPR) repeat protein
MNTLPAPLVGLARPIVRPCALWLFNRGWERLRRGRPAQAHRVFGWARAVAHWCGDAVIEGHALTSLGVLFAVASAAPDHLQQALSLHQEALGLFRKVDNWFGQAMALGNMGSVYEDLGQHDRALDVFRRAASLHHAAGARGGEGEAWTGVALAYTALDAPAQAREVLEDKVLTFSAEVGRPDMPARVLLRLGEWHWKEAEYEAAFTYLEQSLDLFRQASDWNYQTAVLRRMGAVRAKLGQPEDAARWYRRALEACDHSPARWEQSDILHDLALTLYDGLGRRDEAIAVLEGAIARLQRYGLPGPPVGVSLKQMRADLTRMRAGKPLAPADAEPLSAASAEA